MNIISERVYIRGKVLGDIDAAQLIYITSTGSVKGDISSRKVVLESGAVFSGKCTMLEGGSPTADAAETAVDEI